MASVFEQIEKLITEHGSAAILRERLHFAGDQYAALERKNAELQAENDKLRREVESLRVQNTELRKSIPQDTDTPDGFDKNTRKILHVFFQLSDNVSVDQIVRQTGLNRPTVEYHCGLLCKARLIRQTRARSASSPCMYGIMPEGRGYAVRSRIQQ
jgi:cell division protein FtsB